jgi:hypothetical protein
MQLMTPQRFSRGLDTAERFLGGPWNRSRARRPLAPRGLLVAAALAACLAAGPGRSFAASGKPTPAGPAASAPSQAYRPVELATWVPVLRTPARIILHPSPVSFQAEFADGPRPQKTDYLQQALQVMQVSEPPEVHQAVLLRYGPTQEQQLVAYIEDAAAQRLRQEVKPGEKREFFAIHVYNYAKGPALVITSFGPVR